MLTPKRHVLIEELLEKKRYITIQELVDTTGVSESTIRRDLSELEKQNRLIRVHGGASLRHTTRQELSYPEKSIQYVEKKKSIAKLAATVIEEHDFIYLDAGTTTYEMIPHLVDRNITVVTNGLTHLDLLSQLHIQTYLLGGFVKETTKALIGARALTSLGEYHFNKCFIGVNALDLNHGYTTPDPEEAAIKQKALECSEQRYILADHSKLHQVAFAKIANLDAATLIIDEMNEDTLLELKQKTEIKVVNE
ncbi:DeoR family fructose operon transcriptional repressor [Natronobacillus azotifigens]|uniref:DeoR/GlpR family DNA-binding transcription regulator n=1 Tax=Natronobacillus azotifigens TaxID=472978 RepID=A0A9J6R9R6_9BACI|nr:DeoR/GlpR family DNA-binding transcription regulator [Natronobacillus azotifigens]MCZ0702028.1 DeoR/GlpR family DNA-binding transcription regulator [Natronobacillus azotifigens]